MSLALYCIIFLASSLFCIKTHLHPMVFQSSGRSCTTHVPIAFFYCSPSSDVSASSTIFGPSLVKKLNLIGSRIICSNAILAHSD